MSISEDLNNKNNKSNNSSNSKKKGSSSSSHRMMSSSMSSSLEHVVHHPPMGIMHDAANGKSYILLFAFVLKLARVASSGLQYHTYLGRSDVTEERLHSCFHGVASR